MNWKPGPRKLKQPNCIRCAAELTQHRHYYCTGECSTKLLPLPVELFWSHEWLDVHCSTLYLFPPLVNHGLPDHRHLTL